MFAISRNSALISKLLLTNSSGKLGIGFNETTPDGRFTLKEGECMGACGDAPVLLVNNVRMCSFMQPEQIDRLLGECQ